MQWLFMAREAPHSPSLGWGGSHNHLLETKQERAQHVCQWQDFTSNNHLAGGDRELQCGGTLPSPALVNPWWRLYLAPKCFLYSMSWKLGEMDAPQWCGVVRGSETLIPFQITPSRYPFHPFSMWMSSGACGEFCRWLSLILPLDSA